MSKDPDVLPDPDEVGALVERLVRSQWPTSEAQRLEWFALHELDVQGAHRAWGEYGSDSFQGEGPGRWGGPSLGWHMFEGDFVGVSWFLWRGNRPEAVRAAASRLRERFSSFAGAPVEESMPLDDPVRFTALWEVGGCTIDLYLHGGPVLEGALVEDSVVQLHVDHAVRSLRADEAAVRAQTASGQE